MTVDTLLSIRELDHRCTDGVQVRLLWSRENERVWVSVLDTRSSRTFDVEVRRGERPLDVFNHPFAYAAHHGVRTAAREQPVTAV